MIHDPERRPEAHREPADAANAEPAARRGRGVSVDELVASSRSVFERARPVLHRALGSLRDLLARR